MAQVSDSTKTTKDLILDAAFSFCNEPRYKAFSLSELAAKVGITKPAIYRHYKNKEAVYAAMYERFVDTLAGCLGTVQSVKERGELPVEQIADLICFFTENTCYVNYMLGSLASVQNFEYQLTLDLEKRGIENRTKGFQYLADGTGKVVIKDFDEYIRSMYCGVTVFIFIKGREKSIQAGEPVDTPRDFARKVVQFLLTGLSGAVGAENPLYPQALSEARMAELDALCSLTPDMLPAENRFFTAFASVIRKYKMTGITIERIADELGMAKSSLYEYFDNKNELVKTLIVKEISLLDIIVKENCIEAQNASEFMYVLMRTELAFFQQHKSIIPVLGWLLMSSMDDAFIQQMDSDNAWAMRLEEAVKELDFGMDVQAREFLGWVSGLPISLTVQCANRDLESEQLLHGLKRMFCFMENGTGLELQ